MSEHVHKFAHNAMATTFEIFLATEDESYAASIAQEAWTLLDTLEDKLSRFRPQSDISILNMLEPGESLRLSIAAFDCLKLAFEISTQTNGAFDVSLATVMDEIRNERGEVQLAESNVLDAAFEEKRKGLYLLSIEDLTVYCQEAGSGIDLGGIGKGFALDQLADYLEEWELSRALLHSGGSTVLALDAPKGAEGWKVGFGDESGRESLWLTREAMSGSGTAVKGAHVLDPRTARPAETESRTWARAPSAALADALSTAFMVFSPQEVDEYCREHPGILAYR
ncbi:MAG: FAD:protein FMN transferase [Opitutae bacterium]|nr:FAD:protein FMN transferase [Opitutae bacterium]MBT7854034.1 FAD:protein FMN transferase [Opitutae bacterium]